MNKIITVKEAAKETGMSVEWWRKKISERKIRIVRIGSRIFIPKEVVDEIQTKGFVEPRTK